MLLRQEVERRKLAIIRKLLDLGLSEINGQTLDKLTLTQLEEILIASLQVCKYWRVSDMILTRDWRNGDMVHLKRKKFRDMLRAVQELEKRGYSCVHPIRSLVQRQREFVHKRTNGKISPCNYSFTQTDADTCYVVMMRKEKSGEHA
ncbi:hypothetical protein BACERE00183_02357 [Bacillus cereus]|nr:hypothetical protein BACERE00183_02357 [Bacillus cereus]